MISVVTGVPGVGKTTVLNEALKLLPSAQTAVFGDVMFQIAKDLKLVSRKDEMRTRIGPEKYREIQKQAAERIAAMKGNVIVDTHCSIKTPLGYIAGLPEWVLRALSPRTIVLIEAEPKDIEKRRKTDVTRQRADFGGGEEALEHQAINRAYAAAYSVLTGASVAVIVNRQGKAADAARQLAEVLR